MMDGFDVDANRLISWLVGQGGGLANSSILFQSR
jgi:hypothetical protein